MSGYRTKLTEHYWELAEGEVALAKYAVTNQARAEHYARAAEHLRLAKAAEEFGSNNGIRVQTHYTHHARAAARHTEAR
jgi:hypothetical protein